MISLLSCKDKRWEQITRLVTEWQGKEISFPTDLAFTRYALDTIATKIPDTKYKVLVYVDSLGCISCKLQLKQWKQFITYSDSISNGDVSFLFFFHPKDAEEMEHLLKLDRFDIPVCLDWEDKLNHLNKFPSDMNFQTFLLDRDNKVVLIGNPIYNFSIKDIYVNYFTGDESPSSTIADTKAEVENPVISMGTLGKGESKEGVFIVKNTGNRPLVILDAVTTCGCAEVSFDKRPVPPGESVEIQVKMTPKEDGFFDETITLKSNSENLLRLKIKGQAR